MLEIAQSQHRDILLMLGLVLTTTEMLELSVLYSYLIWRLWHTGTSLSRQYQLVLALLTSFFGCLGGFLLFLLKLKYDISWIFVLWVRNDRDPLNSNS